MAGHKRPNGAPICPPQALPPTPISARPRRLTRTNATSYSDVQQFVSGTTGHRRNPNWVERAATPPVDEDERSHASWVPTEPADDGAEEGFGFGYLDDEEKVQGDEEDSRSDSAASQSSSSSVRRTISQALLNSIPLASLFSTPREDIPAITKAARRQGLAMGLLRAPDVLGQGVKSEDMDGTHEANIGRQNSWWVVMGRDQGAVSHLLDLNESSAKDQQDEVLSSYANGRVGAYPLDPRSIRMTFLDVIIAGAIGGIVVLYGLSVL